MLEDRVDRLLSKAEQAVDRGDLDQAESYRILASQTAYLRRKEARELDRMMHGAESETRP